MRRAAFIGMSPKRLKALFADSPHQPRHRSYRTDGRNVHYVEAGGQDRPLALLVHGSPGSWVDFVALMSSDALQEKARLISVDRPGFGRSDAGIVERSLTRQAADFRPLLETNRSGRPAILVGRRSVSR